MLLVDGPQEFIYDVISTEVEFEALLLKSLNVGSDLKGHLRACVLLKEAVPWGLIKRNYWYQL